MPVVQPVPGGFDWATTTESPTNNTKKTATVNLRYITILLSLPMCVTGAERPRMIHLFSSGCMGSHGELGQVATPTDRRTIHGRPVAEARPPSLPNKPGDTHGQAHRTAGRSRQSTRSCRWTFKLFPLIPPSCASRPPTILGSASSSPIACLPNTIRAGEAGMTRRSSHMARSNWTRRRCRSITLR